MYISHPYKLASRAFHPEDTIVTIHARYVEDGTVKIGDKQIVMMAGPSSIES